MFQLGQEDDVKPQIKLEPEEPGTDTSQDRETPDTTQFPPSNSSPFMAIKEEKPLARSQEEPMDVVDAMENHRKMERKEKKVKKEKKDKKIKKEKDVVVKEDDQEPELLPLPPPILKETELKGELYYQGNQSVTGPRN